MAKKIKKDGNFHSKKKRKKKTLKMKEAHTHTHTVIEILWLNQVSF